MNNKHTATISNSARKVLFWAWLLCNVDQLLTFFFLILAEFSTTAYRIIFLCIFLLRPTVLLTNFLIVFLCSTCMVMNSSRKTQRPSQSSPPEYLDRAISIEVEIESSQTDAQIVINSIPLLILFNLEAIQIYYGGKEHLEYRKKTRAFTLVFTHALFHSLPLMVLIFMEQTDGTFWQSPFVCVTIFSLLLTAIFTTVIVLPTSLICSNSPTKVGVSEDEKSDYPNSIRDRARRSLANQQLGIGPIQNPPTPFDLPILRDISCQQNPFTQPEFEPPAEPINAERVNFIRKITDEDVYF